MCDLCGLSSAGRLRADGPEPGYRGTPLSAIDWGTALDLDDGVLTVGFHPGGSEVVFPAVTPDEDREVFSTVSWEEGEIEAALLALDLYAEIIPITVERAPVARADFRLAKSPDMEGAMFGTPGEAGAGLGVFQADLFDPDFGALAPGSYNFGFLIHEFGHGFGLAHPHDDGGRSDLMRGVADDDDVGAFGLNRTLNTVMSYVDRWAEAPGALPSFDFGDAMNPSAFDIAVLQDKYGANTAHASGDDVYRLPDANRVGTGFETIWDAGGRDTIRYDGNRDATIRLEPASLAYEPDGGGAVSSPAGIAGGYTIAADVAIEIAVGGNGDDDIAGNALDNRLYGSAGSDTIAGLGGADSVRGNEGPDRIDGGTGDDTVAGGRGADTVSGNAGDDRLGGNAGEDVLLGYAGDDALRGGGGDDYVAGGYGADALGGGPGEDWLSGASGDDFAAGGPGRDLLEGGSGADSLLGGSGRDLVAGEAGDDRLAGGPAADRLEGGTGADRLAGGTHDDGLRGGPGPDRLAGGPGADRLHGEAGDDRLLGGPGADRFVFRPDPGRDRIGDFAPGTDVVELRGFGFADGAAVLERGREIGDAVGFTLAEDVGLVIAGVGLSDLSPDDFVV